MISQKKQIIIEKSADLFHQYGYNNTGLNLILKELNIPKGSFYNYFESKEALAVEVVSLHIDQTRSLFEQSTVNKRNTEGIKDFFKIFFDRILAMDFNNGCPIGNLITELSDLSEPVRLELLKWIEYLEDEIGTILKESEIEDPEAMASFIVAAFEGVILKAKVEKNDKALKNFNQYILNNLLKN